MLAAFLMTDKMLDINKIHKIADLTDGGLVLFNGEATKWIAEVENILPDNWLCLEREWTNFADMLNYGFMMLKNMTYDWVFRVDSDMDISEIKDLKSVIRDYEEMSVILGWGESHWQTRLIKSDVEWVGVTHEWTKVSADKIVKDDRLPVKEAPKTSEQYINKFRRDYKLLLNSEATARTRFYCGYSVWALWRWNALPGDIALPLATHYLYEALALEPSFEETCWIVYHLVEFVRNEAELSGTEESKSLFRKTLLRWLRDYPLCIELHIMADRELDMSDSEFETTFPGRETAEAMGRNLVWEQAS
jgi:hypothetical protein